jgi:hypothetical protein
MSATSDRDNAGSRFGHYTECAIWLAIAVGMWIYSYAFDIELSTYALGPVSWPRAIIVLVAIAAIGAFVADRHARRRQHDRPDGEQPVAAAEAMDGRARIQLAAALFVPLVYVWLLPRAGYFATTPFFLAAYMYVLGISSWRTILVVTAIAYVLLLVIFSKLLYLPLPTGNWPGFYDFSNWLLVLLRN